ncbi:lamin tail domain-containing protein [Rubricoccus marinus]|uniref:LTD domain-containing protein n=1 Tax=Rubricoccus marinus TaxID=716817 RepID=A0A259TWW4_9BACT|nr:lamin tail domain-containing protein [Rubricoccus marinus]OZC02190.1 hypothetical protein BSZ36_03820 [Rubricoccus marinus]
MLRLLPLALLAALLAPEALAQTPAAGEVVINEILYDPPTGGASNEWVELVNRSDRTVDLAGLVLSDVGSSADALAGPQPLAPGEFLVLVRDEAAFQAAFPGVAFVAASGFPSLNNGGDRVSISIGGTELDAVDYDPSWGGTDASLERRDPDGPSTQPNFTTSTASGGGTPGAQNTAFETDTTAPTLQSAQAESATLVVARFSEPLDAASAETAANYSISGGIGQPASAEVLDDDASVVRLTLAQPLAPLQSYTLTASGVQDRAGNALASGSVTFGFGEGAAAVPGDLVINEFLYDEPTADNPGEFVELFNRTDKTFDLSDFTLNDAVGDDEPVTDAQVLVLPGDYAVIVEDGALFQALFPGVAFVEQSPWSALNNSGDAIVLKYQGVTVDSLTYTPSWGGEDASLERKDPAGPSSVAVNWATTTDPRGGTPGAQNSQFAPDTAGPQPLAVTVAPNETSLVVTFDEPLAPEAVSAGAFSITGGPAVTAAALSADGTAVTLTLASRLPAGDFTLVASGLRDLLGNTTASGSVAFSFAADVTAPAIARASASGATTVLLDFTEPVVAESASTPASYTVDGLGQPTGVTVLPASDGSAGTVVGAVLTYGAPFPDRQLLTVRARGLRDPAGNVRDETSATFFFGTPDAPLAGDLAITEIMYDPQTGGDGEYVEIQNLTADKIFDLRDLVLDDDASGDRPVTGTPSILAPGEFLAIVADLTAFRATFPDAPAVEADDFPGLGNAGDLVILKASGAVLDSVVFDPAWHRVELDDATGVSLERRDPRADANDSNNWSSSLDPRGGTPSAPNSIGAGTPAPPEGTGLTVSPSPFDASGEEGTTISYSLEAEASLVRVRIYDGAGRAVRELEGARLTGRTGSLLWDGRDDRGERLRIGPYIVLLEAVDTEGGTTEAYKSVVILARDL